jgi:hypothetical protein
MMPRTMDGEAATGLGSGGTEDAGQRRADGPALPYAKAFVVQFSADTDPGLEHASGRVEHLQTGRQGRFSSVADLAKCIAALLGDMPSP